MEPGVPIFHRCWSACPPPGFYHRRRCPEVSLGCGASTSSSLPLTHHVPSPSGHVTRSPNRPNARAQRTHGIAQPNEPSDSVRHTVTSGPCLRRTHDTTACRATPARSAWRTLDSRSRRSAQQRTVLFFTLGTRRGGRSRQCPSPKSSHDRLAGAAVKLLLHTDHCGAACCPMHTFFFSGTNRVDPPRDHALAHGLR